MDLQDKVALVTGANRGIGKAILDQLVAAGVRRVYAATRSPLAHVSPPNVIRVAIDLLRPETILAAGRDCQDVQVLVNNAGIMLAEPLIAATDADAAEREMQVNFFGTLRMIRTFAPILARNGGGAVVNVLSIGARVNAPRIGSYCASKAAALSLTQAARAELGPQGIRVIGVLPGFVDTDMARRVKLFKVSAQVVAQDIIDALRGDAEEVYTGPAAEIAERLASEPKAVEREFASLLRK